mmetsp:Transcript_32783/g.72958  ORF Transcript_32783/g.72958 Transcript_32783/m.72958 type:complete len:650 (-) Transcript_32783:267-2216(-)
MPRSEHAEDELNKDVSIPNERACLNYIMLEERPAHFSHYQPKARCSVSNEGVDYYGDHTQHGAASLEATFRDEIADLRTWLSKEFHDLAGMIRTGRPKAAVADLNMTNINSLTARKTANGLQEDGSYPRRRSLVAALGDIGTPMNGTPINGTRTGSKHTLPSTPTPKSARRSEASESVKDALHLLKRGESERSFREGVDKHKMDWDSWMEQQVAVQEVEWELRWGEAPDNWLARFVLSNNFLRIVSLLIFANTLLIGIEVDASMRNVLRNPDEEKWIFFFIANLAFTIFFTIEIIIRIVALRSAFIFTEDWHWNLLDAALVVISFMDFVTPGTDVRNGESRAYMRLLRIFRVGRVLRIVRIVRFFRELRRMCMSIVSITVSFAWAMLLLVLICFVFSVLFMQAGIENVRERGDELGLWKHYYGTLPETMYTLCKAVSGGEDWGPMVEPLEAASVGYLLAFIFYQLFVTLGVFNVLIGTFLTNAVEMFEADRDWLMQAELIHADHFKKNLADLLVEVGLTLQERCTWEQYMIAIEEPRARVFLSSCSLDIFDFHMVFSQMAKDHKVKVKDFVEGVTRMRMYAKQAHIIGLVERTETLYQETAAVRNALHVVLANFQSEAEEDAENNSVVDSSSSSSSPQTQLRPEGLQCV